ncbi:MAG: ATP-binding protein, partial [Deltaproteobacteria bacterium]|nr:ATP-binding protein [Deltaproteobacteria bacterium]
MARNFINTYKRLLRTTDYSCHRYMYDEFNLENRLTGLIGARGVGKTTLLLQYIKEKIADPDECIYASIDNIYFANNRLSDFVNELYEEYGVRNFFLDEIHKYPDWNQELKNIYDSYPDCRIVFSGSSSIDLVKGAYDLSRRGVLFRLAGMSFREYLKFNEIADIAPITFDQLLKDRKDIEDAAASIKKLKGHFKAYLGEGYYPFHLEGKESYRQKVLRIIDKSLYEDIPNFYKLKTENLPCFKRILYYLATIPPGELNRNSLAKNIGIDNKTIRHYLQILYETGLVELLRENRSGSRLLKNTEKMFLDNPDLYSAIIAEIGYKSQTGTIREIFFLKMLKNSGNIVHYSKVGDFVVNDTIFEVGGKSKSKKQIKNKLET